MGEADVPSAEHPIEKFYRAEYGQLVRFVLSRGARLGEAEDVVQEVMAQAFARWENLTNPHAWVRKAAIHVHIRVRERGVRVERLAALVARMERVDGPAAEPPGAVSEVELVRKALAALPRAQREVFAYCLDGYKPQEIAELIGKKPDAVRSNLREARQRLKKLLPPPPVARRAVDEQERDA